MLTTRSTTYTRGRRRRALGAAGAALACVLALTSCGGSDDGSGGDAKTLRLWHYEAANSAMGAAWNEAIKEFEAEHPGVKVKFEEKSFDQIQKTASMVLGSDDAPDLMEYNKGNATAGLLSKQGLLTDMTAEVTKRGWDKQLSPSITTTSRYSPQGTMGSGKWYGVPNYGEFLQAYYNEDLFKKYDIKVPTTFDELTTALAEFKKQGVTPLANSGAEYLAHQYVYQLALTKADRAWVDDYELKGKADFHDAAWTYAAKTFADWVKKGYIAKNTTSATAENAGVSWLRQKSPIIFSGTWWFGRFQDEATFDWTSGIFPGATLTPGSGGNLWVVPAKSKNKELAYDFIDITMSKKIQNLLGNKGGVPVSADASAVKEPKSQQLIKDFNTLSDKDGLAYYPDWPVAGFYETLVSQTQRLMTGSASPDEYLDALQAAYDKGASKG
ncbi:extracellular solute-binding protein [Streptomyces sp. SID8379]|uniref:extracellular solute-binding protein n=1 Tax=unclassified Streptomyces TaxID=2593676 RepID=UPI000375A78A|nr:MULTISPECIES: extracellular solute-binding protein [unclassified Streptomyces]MYW64352.1 extracellular solute-binding protein [Streptomyces sp. SID8379]